jgi:cytochrome b561
VVAVAPALLVAIARHERSLAWAVHLALYALMFAMPVSGIAMSQAGEHPVHILGITLPTMVARDEALRAASQRAHHLMAWAIGILIAAALRHRLVAKDAIAASILTSEAVERKRSHDACPANVEAPTVATTEARGSRTRGYR